MTKEELKEKIADVLGKEESLPYPFVLEKIMLLIDEYKEEKVVDHVLLCQAILKDSFSIRVILKEQCGFTQEQLEDLCMEFLDLNYPKGGNAFKIRSHFVNWARKRKPQTKNEW